MIIKNPHKNAGRTIFDRKVKKLPQYTNIMPKNKLILRAFRGDFRASNFDRKTTGPPFHRPLSHILLKPDGGFGIPTGRLPS